MPFRIEAYERLNGDSPFYTFRATLEPKQRAQIDAWIKELQERGAYQAPATKQVGKVWEVRKPSDFRVYFFWDAGNRLYVLLNGHRKQGKSKQTSAIRRAEQLRIECEDRVRRKERPWKTDT